MAKAIDYAAVRATFAETKRWRAGGNVSKTARLHGIAIPTATRIIADPNYGARAAAANTRHEMIPLSDRHARLPALDSPFLTEKRTRYLATVREPDGSADWVLKDAHNAAKIGRTIRKGEWAGMRMWTLTLEERATCPTSCRHWRSCFGNKMHFAQRWAAGPALEKRLRLEVGELARQHPAGFVVRLHVLGDFYSVPYVRMWRTLLKQHPALRIWGYTARWDYQADPIARELVDLARTGWDRFAMRFSNAPIETCSTISIETPLQAPPDAIVCPEQLGKVATCAECALCWSTNRRIAFLQH